MDSESSEDFTFDNLIHSEAYEINDKSFLDSDVLNEQEVQSVRSPSVSSTSITSHSSTVSTALAQRIRPSYSTAATTPDRDLCSTTAIGEDSGSTRWDRPRSVSPRKWDSFTPNHQRALVHAHRINGADGEVPRTPCAQCIKSQSQCRVYQAAAKTKHWVRGGESCSTCYEKHRQCSFITRNARTTERKLREFHRRPERDDSWYSVSGESWEILSKQGRNGKEKLRRFAQVGRIEEVQDEGEAALVPCDRCVIKGYGCRIFTAEAQRKYCQKSSRVCSRCTFSMTASCNALAGG